uniref:Peroxisomal biogenesis factor 19 n=1 Tax=Buteo japonicus TaxID=224669 RepID=A0A8C0AUC3_9AVES
HLGPRGLGPRDQDPLGWDGASLFASQERFFQELFEGELASQAAAEFEQAMQELAREEPHLVEQFQKLSEAAGRVGSDTASQQEFTSCLKETLSGLAKNATDLQSSSASEEELAKALEGLGLEEGDGEGSVLPVMRSIMQSLLSKDVLYPSLKEITEKVGGPVAPRRDVGQVQWSRCDPRSPPTGEEERRARFETLLDLMQQLQDLGHPPKELAGESVSGSSALGKGWGSLLPPGSALVAPGVLPSLSGSTGESLLFSGLVPVTSVVSSSLWGDVDCTPAVPRVLSRFGVLLRVPPCPQGSFPSAPVVSQCLEEALGVPSSPRAGSTTSVLGQSSAEGPSCPPRSKPHCPCAFLTPSLPGQSLLSPRVSPGSRGPRGRCGWALCCWALTCRFRQLPANFRPQHLLPAALLPLLRR